jgi:hypothetical protein
LVEFELSYDRHLLASLGLDLELLLEPPPDLLLLLEPAEVELRVLLQLLQLLLQRRLRLLLRADELSLQITC